MLISTLIKVLERCKELYGDIPVVNWAIKHEVDTVEKTIYQDIPVIVIQ